MIETQASAVARVQDSAALLTPELTGVEKAERQLLRAAFSADWRVYILSQLPQEHLVTQEGRKLFEIISRTPAESDGSLNPRTVFYQIEAEIEKESEEENGKGQKERQEEGQKEKKVGIEGEQSQGLGFRVQGSKIPNILHPTPSSQESTPYTLHPTPSIVEDDPFANEVLPSGWQIGIPIPEEPVFSDQYSTKFEQVTRVTQKKVPTFEKNTKFLFFVQEVLQDSVFLVSNEQLNQVAIQDCILRLKRYREEQARRELADMLLRADELPTEQRRAFIEQYHRTVREKRGSPPENSS